MYSIYEIRNKESGKVYVGYSKDVKKRWSQHRSDLSKGTHHCQHLQNAWNKYGTDAFEFVAIEQDKYSSKEEAGESEKTRTEEYRSQGIVYNTTKGGLGGGMQGKHHSEETKQKQRESAQKENHYIPDNTGRHHSEETKTKLSKATKRYAEENGSPSLGYRHTEEAKQKIKEKRATQIMTGYRGRKWTPEEIQRRTETRRKNGWNRKDRGSD